MSGETLTSSGPNTKVTLAVSNLTFGVRLATGETKQILSAVNLAVAPGEVLTIMGPSGSGKTSLLNAIAHRLNTKRGEIQGQVLFNGKVLSSRKRRILVSYVAQEDTLLGDFTVRETLWFSARFYFGYKAGTTERIHTLVESLIDTMGLKSCADTIVGSIFFKGLSGGQKRRLSMAVEMVSNPAVLLLDEPTSGLDSASAFAIMEELHHLAKLGHTVVATIHQPSSEIWSRFDQLLLLANGKTVFVGEVKRAVPHFASLECHCPAEFNPADYLMGLINEDFETTLFSRPKTVDELAEAFAHSTLQQTVLNRIGLGAKLTMEYDAESGAVMDPATAAVVDVETEEEKPTSLYRKYCVAGGGDAGFGSNLRTLVHRNFLNNFRNPGIIVVREVMYVMLALMLGLAFLYVGKTYDAKSVVARNSLLFFVAAFFVFMSVAVIPFAMEERAVFLREKRNGAYTVLPYVLAQFLMMLPGTALIASTTSLFIVFMISLNGFGYYVLILWLCLIYAETFVYMVGSISPHYIIGIAVSAGFFGMCMVVEGFFIVFEEIGWWIRWVGYITPHRYAFRAFMRNEYNSILFNETINGEQVVLNGSAILDFYGYNDSIVQSIGGDIGILFAFAMSYLLCFYLICEFYWR